MKENLRIILLCAIAAILVLQWQCPRSSGTKAATVDAVQAKEDMITLIRETVQPQIDAVDKRLQDLQFADSIKSLLIKTANDNVKKIPSRVAAIHSNDLADEIERAAGND